MKNSIVILIVVSFLCSFQLNNDTSVLYERSILKHISGTKADTVYILKCFDINLPTKIGKYAIIDISTDPRSFISNNLSLYAIKIMPIETNKGVLQLTLIDYILKMDNDQLTMSNAGSEIFSYKYEGESKKYALVKQDKNLH